MGIDVRVKLVEMKAQHPDVFFWINKIPVHHKH